MAATIYLITGSARGIGRGIVKELLKRPNTTVFAGVRDPDAPAATELKHFEVGAESKLILLKLDATKKLDNEAAVTSIKSYGISHVDVVIANAGISTAPHQTVDIPEEDFLKAYQVRVPMAVYGRRYYSTILASTNPPTLSPRQTLWDPFFSSRRSKIYSAPHLIQDSSCQHL